MSFRPEQPSHAIAFRCVIAVAFGFLLIVGSGDLQAGMIIDRGEELGCAAGSDGKLSMSLPLETDAPSAQDSPVGFDAGSMNATGGLSSTVDAGPSGAHHVWLPSPAGGTAITARLSLNRLLPPLDPLRSKIFRPPKR